MTATTSLDHPADQHLDAATHGAIAMMRNGSGADDCALVLAAAVEVAATLLGVGA